MSDETTVQLGHQELQDHNELMEYIRKLLEKSKLLTDLYDQNLTALTEHNESESSHPDLRILLAEGNDELQNQLDSFKDDITKKTDATDKRITDGLNDFDLRLRNAVEVNNVQNDRLTALEADVALKIYDKDVSAVGHTGQFDDILNRPKITISDATNEHTGNSIRITGGNTKLVLPSTITADLTGNVTGNCSGSSGSCTGNAATATKLAAKRTIALSGAATGTATGFDGSGNITISVTALDASKLTGTASVSLVADFLSRVYPVGSIYMSAVNVSPASFFGGTWQAIEQGRMLMAAGSSWQAGTTGGAVYHALTVQEMPAHDHSATETAAGGHTHGALTGPAGAHSHSGSTNNAGDHAHTRGSMNITGAFWNLGSAPQGTNGAIYTGDAPTNPAWIDSHVRTTSGNSINFDASRSWTGWTSTNGNHSHWLSISSAGAHTHSVAIAAAGAHTHAITIGKTGSGAEFSILPPYIAVYMWRRTA